MWWINTSTKTFPYMPRLMSSPQLPDKSGCKHLQIVAGAYPRIATDNSPKIKERFEKIGKLSESGFTGLKDFQDDRLWGMGKGGWGEGHRAVFQQTRCILPKFIYKQR